MVFMIIPKSKLKMAQCLLSRDLSKKVHYHSLSQSQLVYLINAAVSLDNGCKKMHTRLNLLAKRTRMVSKLVSLSQSEFPPGEYYFESYWMIMHISCSMTHAYLMHSDYHVLNLYLSGERVHAISEQWHHTHEENCWVVDESDILKLMPQM